MSACIVIAAKTCYGDRYERHTQFYPTAFSEEFEDILLSGHNGISELMMGARYFSCRDTTGSVS